MSTAIYYFLYQNEIENECLKIRFNKINLVIFYWIHLSAGYTCLLNVGAISVKEIFLNGIYDTRLSIRN